MFKNILIIILLNLFITSTLYAGPASPDPIDIQQPDGSSIRARIQGDEFQGWVESDDSGHTILHSKKSGYWEYAEQDTDGTLKPNGVRVMPSGFKAPSILPKGLRPPRDKDRERHMQQMLKDVYQQRFEISSSVSPSSLTSLDSSDAEAAPGDWVPVPVSGAKKALIVLISFADKPMSTFPAGWYTSVFNESAKSVAKYYNDNSFGLMTLSPATHSQPGNPAGIVSVSVADNHPNYGQSYNYTTETTILNHALAEAAAYVDFAVFDTSGNGTLEQSELAIYFIYAGYEASGSSNTPSIWAHAWGGYPGITAGSKKVTRWAQNGELNNSSVQHPMGVIAHELGHALCGLPDLYDISYTANPPNGNQGLGNFSLMAGGSWGGDVGESGGTTPTTLDAWSREFLGWSLPVVLTASGQLNLGYALTSTTAVYKLVIPATSSSEYFLVENRQPTSWDLGLRRYSQFGLGWLGGLLITHIDLTSGTLGSNNINSYTANSSNPGHQGVLPVQASTAFCNMLSLGATCRGHATTLFYSANKTSWTPSSTPNSNYYNGTATYFSLTSISAPGSSMTANLLMPSVPSSITNPASAVGATSSTLNGTVNDNFSQTTVTFQYGLSTSYGSTASGGVILLASGSTSVGSTITGLSCNTLYHFRVYGTNSYGTGYGTDNTFTTAACPPGAPVITSVIAGNSQASIYFAPPASDGGSPILDYIVTPSTGLSVTSDSIPITVAGLTNGNSYTFTVRTRNIVGTGPASEASVSVIPGVAVIDDNYANGYQLLQDAYDADAPEEKIMLLADVFVGDLTVTTLNEHGTISIKGGYDNAFSGAGGMPSIIGKITLSAGKTVFENVVIRSP